MITYPVGADLEEAGRGGANCVGWGTVDVPAESKVCVLVYTPPPIVSPISCCPIDSKCPL